MYNTYGAIKVNNENVYRFKLYAPNALEVKLVLDGVEHNMSRHSDDWYIETNAHHLDPYYYIIDGTEKFDPFAKYITDGYESRVYDFNYDFKYDKVVKEVDEDSRIIEFYLPLVKGDTYKEKALEMVKKVNEGNYTHVLLMPVQHHWYIGSMGYHTQGFFAPTHFYGTPDDFKEMVDLLHKNETSIILDYAWWETTPSPGIDDLYDFDGGIYLSEEYNEEFGGHYFDLDSPYVKEFVKTALRFWLNVYKIDFIKLDGINEFVFTRPDHRTREDKIEMLNDLTKGLEDRLMLEFIDMKNPIEFGFNVKHHDGIIVPYLLQELYRRWDNDKKLIEHPPSRNLIKKLRDRDGQPIGLNHNIFMKSISYNERLPEELTYDSLIDIAKLFVRPMSQQEKEQVALMLKLVHATKRTLVEFAHLEESIGTELKNEYEEFKQLIESTEGLPTLDYDDENFIITFANKEIKLNVKTKETTVKEVS